MISQTEPRFSLLLVEKDHDIHYFVKKSLERNPRFPAFVDHATNVKDALKKLKQRSYQLLLVESELEKEEGLKLFEEMKRAYLNLPFVLMMPVRDDLLVREAIKQGVSDIIVKSENHFLELSERLKKSFQRFYGFSQDEELEPPLAESLKHQSVRMEDCERAPVLNKDHLTGLYTHGHLHDRVVREFSSATRYGYPITCLMIDIDHFKTLNETHGYPAGESLIRQCADLLFESCRLSDFVARYGGQEFAVLFPHVNYENAMVLASRVGKAFEQHDFQGPAGPVRLTISIGVSSYPEDPIKHRGELITFAAQALARSKAAGRNRVTFYKDIIPDYGEGFPGLQISDDKILEFQRRMTEITIIARKSYMDAAKALIGFLENKDRFTAGHSASCAKYATYVAEKMGMSSDEAEAVHHAALLHDIGKICIPDEILLKPGRLTLQEFETMKQHPYFGYKILKPIRFLQQEAIFVLHHHEWWNGEGYPCRLKGGEIPLGARIISVIDSYDTMRAAGGRYKKTSTVENTVNELIACSGIQFDPEVVKSFVTVLQDRGDLQSDAYNKARLEEILKSSAKAA